MKSFTGHLAKAFVLLVLLATAAAASSGDMARQVLAEVNLARSEPQRYAGQLRQFRRQYEGKGYRVPGSLSLVITEEGVAAVDEAIACLSRQKPLPPLSWSQGLAEAARDLVRDEGPTGEVGHSGRRSGTMRERIERHGTWSGRIGENIGYGPNSARLMVMELIVDDGVGGRGHRKNIFNAGYRTAGVACGAHAQYRSMCVIDFAGGYRGKKEKGP